MKKGASLKSAPPALSKKALRSVQVLESSGDWITGNHWIQVGLTRSQVRAITCLGKRWSIQKSPCATMARYLISLGLLNLDDTQAKLESLVKYVEAEGFNSLGKYCDKVMQAQERLGSE